MVTWNVLGSCRVSFRSSQSDRHHPLPCLVDSSYNKTLKSCDIPPWQRQLMEAAISCPFSRQWFSESGLGRKERHAGY